MRVDMEVNFSSSKEEVKSADMEDNLSLLTVFRILRIHNAIETRSALPYLLHA
jgi:hypothetical protein